jgi:type IV secretory pathway TraG/TraD family ATPase VirD4
VFSPDLKGMMSKGTTIDIEKLANEKCILFICTSPVNPSLNIFADMFYSQLIKSLFEYAETKPDGRLPVPVRMFFDDFATGGRIYNFTEYISIFREKQISVMLLLQSESQLNGMYGDNNATTIINNCDTYIYLGGMDLQTARSVSERLNAPLDDVLYMPVGQEFVFRRGQRPIITERYEIYKDELFQKVNRLYEAEASRQLT